MLLQNEEEALFQKVRKRRFVNLTPLIDMMFLLTIFFMLTTSFSKYTEVKMSIASIGSEEGNEAPLPPQEGTEKPMNVVIMPRDKVLFEGQEIPIEEFVQAIKEKSGPNTPFIIQTVEDARVQDTVSTMEKLYQAGASNFIFSEEAP